MLQIVSDFLLLLVLMFLLLAMVGVFFTIGNVSCVCGCTCFYEIETNISLKEHEIDIKF